MTGWIRCLGPVWPVYRAVVHGYDRVEEDDRVVGLQPTGTTGSMGDLPARKSGKNMSIDDKICDQCATQQ